MQAQFPSFPSCPGSFLPFLGRSGNYRSPITYPSVTKQNGLLFCVFCLFLCFFCFVLFLNQDPRFHCSDFGSGLKSCGTLNLRNGPLVQVHVLALYSMHVQRERAGRKERKMQLMHFSFFKKNKINLMNNKVFRVVAFSMKVQLDICL